ncbi:MAG: MMPL family transporter [Polyangia bacterium]
MKALWSRFAAAYIGLSFRRPAAVLAVILAVAAACATLAALRIRVVTDLAALLPEGTPSVEALEMSKERVGSTDYFTIAIHSDNNDARAIARVQDLLAERIEQEWDDADWVQVGRETGFFREHALYYLPEEDLEEIVERLDEELIAASAESIPGMVNLLDDDDDEKKDNGDGIEGWYDPELPRRLGLPAEVADEFDSFFEKKRKDRDPEKQDEEHREGRPDDLSSRLISERGDVGVVLVQLAKPSTDLDYARFALGRGEDLIESIEPASIAPDLEAQVVGAYRSFMEVDAVSDDGIVATSISLTLVLVLMFAFFRSPRTVAAVVLPMIAAGSVTMGITAIVYGRLTLLTVFVLAMLIGMGIDYGIHLFGRTIIEFRSGRAVRDATETAVRESGGALLAAALTTIASLLTLLLGHFEGFKEFGVVASYGLMLSVTCAIVCIPPTVALLDRIRPLRRSALRDDGEKPERGRRLFGLPMRPALATMLVLGALISAVLAIWIPQAGFENNLRNLRAPKTKNTIGYGRAVGKSASTTPAVMLGEDRAQMREVHDFLLHKQNVEKDPTLKSFVTFYTFVPPREAQRQRAKIIDRIRKLVDKRAFDRLEGDKRRMIDELREMSRAAPVDETEIPEWALRIVTERDGTVGRIGHLHARVEDWHAVSVRRFHDAYGSLEFAGRWLPIANSKFILSDVVAMVKADGKRLAVMVSIALVVLLLAFTRSLRAMLILTAAVGVAALWTVGMMGLWEIRIGLYNLIAIPVILGVGIDAAIHLLHRHRELGREGIAHNLRTTGLTITASSWTTVAGFVGLLFVSHKGLRTIGVLASTGVALSWLAILLVLPGLLYWLAPKK